MRRRRGEPDLDSVGGRVQAARLAKGLTQEKLAELVGVSKGAVSQWEAGDIKSLKAQNLMRLSEVTETSPRWLILGKERDGTPIQMGRPTHLDPEASDLVETFRLLEPQFRDALVQDAHKYLRLSAAQQKPSRTDPYPQAPKVKKSVR